ncbi:hypothetical protein JKF63_01969 [Porcisia hertigi]|uniref:Uncharacterized protein n=1 Tax=Porcisia hertigi TaxID=2761500 RepID=A0A836L0V7_9TRYP|nr:hypothetical protein JKF63_01969 [Porcisia hertigi]
MRRFHSVTALRLGQCGGVPHCPARQPCSTAIGARRFCTRATRVLFAFSGRSRAGSPPSTFPPPAKASAVRSEEISSETPPPLPPLPDTRAAFSTQEAPISTEVASPGAAAEPTTGGAEHLMTDAFAQPRSPPLPPPPSPPRQDSLLRRLLASWQQGVVASIGAVMGIGFLVYFLYTPVKEDTVHHTAVVASEALADSRLREQAVQLTKDVLLEVLRNPKSLDATVDVVVTLLGREETKIAVSSLLQSLFEDHYTQEVTKKFVLRVVQDPWIQDQLQMITEEQVRKLLNNAAIKTELSKFLLKSAMESLEKPQLHYEAAKAVRHSVASLANFWWS